MLTEEIKKSISESVLCWLATTDEMGNPNCSPKEVFTNFGEKQIVIANIASPESVKNIRVNPNVCISFVNVFKQKGYKLKGKGAYISSNDDVYAKYLKLLNSIFGNNIQIKGIIVVEITSAFPVIAPSYYLVSGTTEESQIASAKITYNV